MPDIDAGGLERLVAGIFAGAGCPAAEAATVAGHLVLSNLVGHDSHGVIRVGPYLEWLDKGMVRAGQTPTVAFDSDVAAVVDGNLGFGQVTGETAVDTGVGKARARGISIVGTRNAGHLGRIGHWAERAAAAGIISMHYVNTSGFGILVAPFGSTEVRMSANPMAFGAPRTAMGSQEAGPPIILDISTAAIAEGKIKVARAAGTELPPGTVVDADGKPTRDPNAFYGPPRGAILPFGGHKGHGLSIMIELLAGALTGGGTTDPDGATANALVNNMLSVFIAPEVMGTQGVLADETEKLVAWVKSASPATPGGEVLMPGDIERATAARRRAEGIPLADDTVAELRAAAERFGVDATVLGG